MTGHGTGIARTGCDFGRGSPRASAVKEFSTELAIAVGAMCNRVLEK